MCVFRSRTADVVGVFFFKQKTAYEMRISDWSSDVCSSDLSIRARLKPLRSGSTTTDTHGGPAMNLFRNLLFWIVLALVGALLAQLLLADPGYVLVRYRGMDYTTTVAAGLLILFGLLFSLWRVWKLVPRPFPPWRGHRHQHTPPRSGRVRGAVDPGHQ